jgi:hypothetical protein
VLHLLLLLLLLLLLHHAPAAVDSFDGRCLCPL